MPSSNSQEVIPGTSCVKCHQGLTYPYYVMYNMVYCVEDFYAIVVKAAIRTHLSTDVGLAQADEIIPGTTRKYNTVKTFQMTVIDKFIAAMKEYTGDTLAYKVTGPV